jgi:hypothetical protein
MALVGSDVSEKRSASMIMVKRISEIRKKAAVTNN